MADLIAKIRLVVEVPYEYDIGEVDEAGNQPGMTDAAHHANADVLDAAKNSLASLNGTVIDNECLVEEVRQA
jgi:pyruvate carboxylase